jgi:hypothetical protein
MLTRVARRPADGWWIRREFIVGFIVLAGRPIATTVDDATRGRELTLAFEYVRTLSLKARGLA